MQLDVDAAFCLALPAPTDLDGGVDVLLVDADGDAHEHVLRALGRLAVDLEQVRSLERLEAEVGVTVVAVVDDRRVQTLTIDYDALYLTSLFDMMIW